MKRLEDIFLRRIRNGRDNATLAFIEAASFHAEYKQFPLRPLTELSQRFGIVVMEVPVAKTQRHLHATSRAREAAKLFVLFLDVLSLDVGRVCVGATQYVEEEHGDLFKSLATTHRNGLADLGYHVGVDLGRMTYPGG